MTFLYQQVIRPRIVVAYSSRSSMVDPWDKSRLHHHDIIILLADYNKCLLV